MVPEGWEEIRLGDILEFKNGVNADKDRYGRGTKFVNVMDIFAHKFLFEHHITGSVEITAKQLQDYSVRCGDILFNRTSETYDEIAFASVYIDKKEVTFGGFVIRGRPISSKINPYFAAYSLHSYQQRKELIRRGQGAVRANIGQKDLIKIPMVLPPLSEQKKIAEILSTWDRVIDATAKLIKNAKVQKKALMQQLLTGKKRFPEFEGQEWYEVCLENVADIYSSNVDKKTNDCETPILLCNYTDVYYNSHITNDMDFMHASANIREIEKFSLFKNDVIITKDSETPQDIAIPALVDEDLPGVLCGYHLTLIRPHQGKVSGAFLANLFSLPRVQHYFFTRANGATRFGLSIDAIAKAKFSFPSMEEQLAIAATLRNAEEEILNLENQLTSLQEQKKALMQQLLTGKRRVKLDGGTT